MEELEIVKKHIKFSGQSATILKQIPNFPIESFLDWWIQEKMIVGGGHIIEFIDKKMGEK